MPVPMYSCSVCGVATIVIKGQIIRPCNHTEAAVVANMTAQAYGVGSFEQISQPPPPPLLE